MAGEDDSRAPNAASSVEERCPICLDDFKDKAFITSCFHSYCFSCVVRAAEVSGHVCPMCKSRFSKVIHNVRANDDYDVYKIPPFRPSSSLSGPARRQTMEDLNEAIRNFRGYRTTRFPGNNRAVTDRNEQNPGPSTSRTATSTSRDQNLPSSSSGDAHVSTSSRGLGRQRRNSNCHFDGSIRRSSRCAPTATRRAVYSAGVYALSLNTGRRHKVRDISAVFFRNNPATTHRLVPWISREIEALLAEEHVEFMMQLIFSLIDKVDLESLFFPSHLEPFLNERTAHFMHELVSFARSPFDIIAYDENVRYEWPGNHPMASLYGNSTTPAERRIPERDPVSNSDPVLSLGNDIRLRLYEELMESDIDEEDGGHMTEHGISPIIQNSDSGSEEMENQRESPWVGEREENGGMRGGVRGGRERHERLQLNSFGSTDSPSSSSQVVDANFSVGGVETHRISATSSPVRVHSDSTLSVTPALPIPAPESTHTVTLPVMPILPTPAPESTHTVIQPVRPISAPESTDNEGVTDPLEEISIFVDESERTKFPDDMRDYISAKEKGHRSHEPSSSKHGSSKTSHKSRKKSKHCNRSRSRSRGRGERKEKEIASQISPSTSPPRRKHRKHKSRRREAEKRKEKLKDGNRRYVSGDEKRDEDTEEWRRRKRRKEKKRHQSRSPDERTSKYHEASESEDSSYRYQSSSKKKKSPLSYSSSKRYDGSRKRYSLDCHTPGMCSNKDVAQSMDGAISPLERGDQLMTEVKTVDRGGVRDDELIKRDFTNSTGKDALNCPSLKRSNQLGERALKKDIRSSISSTDESTINYPPSKRSDRLIKEAELEAIEEEIKANKHKILKSALKKERIELLHRNMHKEEVSSRRGRARDGNGMGPGTCGGDGRVSKEQVESGRGIKVNQMLHRELVRIDEEIASERKKLLEVVKHIEDSHHAH